MQNLESYMEVRLREHKFYLFHVHNSVWNILQANKYFSSLEEVTFAKHVEMHLSLHIKCLLISVQF